MMPSGGPSHERVNNGRCGSIPTTGGCRSWLMLSPHTFSPTWVGLGRNVIPVGLRRALGNAVERATGSRTDLYLAWLKRRLWNRPPGTLVRYKDLTIRINNGPN